MLPSVLLNWQYSSLLGDLSTRQLDLTATWEISNESRNIETQIALDGALGSQVLVVPEGAICAPASLSSVAKLLLWLERKKLEGVPYLATQCNLHDSNCRLLWVWLKSQRLWVCLCSSIPSLTQLYRLPQSILLL